MRTFCRKKIKACVNQGYIKVIHIHLKKQRNEKNNGVTINSKQQTVDM